MNLQTEEIVGYQVNTLGIQDCVLNVIACIKRPRSTGATGFCRWLACLNPHSYAVSLDDAVFSQALHGADWLVPDGAGIVLASRILDGEIRERVTGSDVFYGVLNELNRLSEYSVFFLGATEETLAEIRVRMSRDYPNVQVAGTYSPPFKPVYTDEELDKMVAVINASTADVLWVGMTAPKQEKWLHAVSPRLNVKFGAAIGAVFDFYTGKVKRSHPLFQKIGLEWLPRLVQQPRRLWKRMFVSAPVFVWHVLRARINKADSRHGV
ncbi:MAG: N-acetylglucosaminyldiphospho-UDP N-acetyl-beta-D-mannosaminyltransferase [Burkholderiales bacterium RIFCSPLOWO2_12_FULL_61_40]|nr:MAG: N-acetylglucosaminyldiphospho-UDP N-acetyl-beta-D-mannosaminyltransferase [Burkholderiales bacterium RIFCSPLOWO2_12_FULL_61_40]